MNCKFSWKTYNTDQHSTCSKLTAKIANLPILPEKQRARLRATMDGLLHPEIESDANSSDLESQPSSNPAGLVKKCEVKIPRLESPSDSSRTRRTETTKRSASQTSISSPPAKKVFQVFVTSMLF